MSANKFVNLFKLMKNGHKFNFTRWKQHAVSFRYSQAISNLPETRITELGNGFRVATEHTDSPVSTVGVWINAGSRYETSSNNGVAHFFEHIAFKSSDQKADKELGNLGAQLSSYTDREQSAFYAKCLSTDATKVVNIIGNALTDVKVDDRILEEERKIILQELENVQNDYRKVVFDYLHLTAFQDTPLQKSVYGTTENIQNINKDDIISYAKNSFVGPKMVLCVSGNVDHEQMVQAAEKTFGATSSTSSLSSVQPCRFTGGEVRHREDWQPFAHVCVALATCGMNSADVYPLMLANTLVGCWNKTLISSANSILNIIPNIYKEKRCHSYEAFHKLYSDIGLWGCYFVMDKMILDDFLSNLTSEWMRLCTSTTDAELTIAKNILRSNLLLAADDSLNVCADIGRQVLTNGKHISFHQLDKSLQSVTLGEFRDVCRKYIYDKCPAVSAIGPVEGLPDYNRVRSSMYWLRY